MQRFAAFRKIRSLTGHRRAIDESQILPVNHGIGLYGTARANHNSWLRSRTAGLGSGAARPELQRSNRAERIDPAHSLPGGDPLPQLGLMFPRGPFDVAHMNCRRSITPNLQLVSVGSNFEIL